MHMRRCEKICEFSHMWHNFRVCNFENAIICGKNMQYPDFATYAIACAIVCSHITAINWYPYNCASVQRALAGPGNTQWVVSKVTAL